MWKPQHTSQHWSCTDEMAPVLNGAMNNLLTSGDISPRDAGTRCKPQTQLCVSLLSDYMRVLRMMWLLKDHSGIRSLPGKKKKHKRVNVLLCQHKSYKTVQKAYFSNSDSFRFLRKVALPWWQFQLACQRSTIKKKSRKFMWGVNEIKYTSGI